MLRILAFPQTCDTNISTAKATANKIKTIDAVSAVLIASSSFSD
jgi:hypothetical protein